MGTNAPAYISRGITRMLTKKTLQGINLTITDRVSTNADETHIGVRNPVDFPFTRGRPHGS